MYYNIMSQLVIKRDGSNEPFEEIKIRNAIESASQVVGFKNEQAYEIINRVLRAIIEKLAANRELETRTIRDFVLDELDFIAPQVAEAWRKHDLEHRKS